MWNMLSKTICILLIGKHEPHQQNIYTKATRWDATKSNWCVCVWIYTPLILRLLLCHRHLARIWRFCSFTRGSVSMQCKQSFHSVAGSMFSIFFGLYEKDTLKHTLAHSYCKRKYQHRCSVHAIFRTKFNEIHAKPHDPIFHFMPMFTLHLKQRLISHFNYI